MSDVLLSTSLVDAVDGSETELVSIRMFVSNDDWLGEFNRLKVYRSKSGSSGPFEEITGADWTRPRIPVSAGDPPTIPVTGSFVNLVGKQLVLKRGTDPYVIVFTGSDPLTLAQATAQIMDQSSDQVVSYVDSSGQLVVESSMPGLDSRLEVMESEGATVLELPVTSEQGKAPRISLVLDQTTYEIRDAFGKKDYYYRTRFFDTVRSAQSEPSVASTPRPKPGVSSSNVIIGYVKIASQTGAATEGAEVHLYMESGGALTDGHLITGRPAVKYTDENGLVEFSVVRGQRVTLSVQGTQIVRTVTVPTDPTVARFSLLDPNIADADVFTVAVPDIVVAERRTL